MTKPSLGQAISIKVKYQRGVLSALELKAIVEGLIEEANQDSDLGRVSKVDLALWTISFHGAGRSHGRAVGGAGTVVAEGCQGGASTRLASAAVAGRPVPSVPHAQRLVGGHVRRAQEVNERPERRRRSEEPRYPDR